jgi:antibiotic biosynthesis monooxygenase (ABM) superfamily enzyme
VESLVPFPVPEIWRKENTMKVTMRTTVKVVPGKMAEYMEIDKKAEAISIRAGGPPWKRYGCVSGDSLHTLAYDSEFDSLAALEAFMEKLFMDPERQQLMAKSDACIVSHDNELLMPMP